MVKKFISCALLLVLSVGMTPSQSFGDALAWNDGISRDTDLGEEESSDPEMLEDGEGGAIDAGAALDHTPSDSENEEESSSSAADMLPGEEDAADLKTSTGVETEIDAGASEDVSDSRGIAAPGERVVADGVYSVACSADPSLVLDVAGGSDEPGANVTLWTDRRDQRQLFRFEWRGGYYSVTALHSGQALDVVASGAASGTNVTQWDATGRDNQLWTVEEAGGGSYRIASKCNGLLLSSEGSPEDGSNVMVASAGAPGCLQSWSLSPLQAAPGERVVADGVYSIAVALDTSKVLDVCGGSQNDGANVTLWDSTSVRWQKFRIEWEDGFYSISALHSGQALDVVASGTTLGTNVTQWSSYDADNQKWMIEATGDGAYRIISKCNGLALSAVGIEAGDNVCTTKPGSYDTWRLVDASEPKPELVLADGIYSIANHSASSQVLDVVEGSKLPGANVTLWTDYGNQWQRFRVEHVNCGYYKIVSINSDQALDVVAGSGWPEANVTQWTETLTDNQLWIINRNDNGSYTITSKCSGLVLGCEMPANEGSNVRMESPRGLDSQQWEFNWVSGVAFEEGVYSIANALDGDMVLDVVAGSSDEGQNVTLWERTNPAWQRFRVTEEEDGYYRIAPLHSGQTLDVVASGTTSGTNVTQWSYFETDNQLWSIQQIQGTGCYRLVSKCNGLALDIDGAAANGTNVMVSAVDESDVGQQWIFNRCSVADSFKIYLDAGHGPSSSVQGQYDPGAVSFGYVENDLTTDLVRRIANICRDRYGICVVENTYGGLYAGRHSEAVRLSCSTFLSIHFNSGGGSGTESYIHSNHAAPGSAELQDIIHNRAIMGTQLFDRGKKDSALAVVNGALPAVLLEVAFIDNPYDMNRYSSRVNAIAEQISAGINEAANNPKCQA